MNDIKWEYVSKLGDKNIIADFEKEVGISLPPDLKLCMQKNNGGMPSKELFDTNKSKKRIFKSLLSFNVDDEETVYQFIPVVTAYDESLFPCALDPVGNIICVRDGKMVLLLHESGEIENVANSFSEFIECLY
jgi:hypothetical protein